MLSRWGNGVMVASMYGAFLMKVGVGEENYYALLTCSGVLILANVFTVVTVLVKMVFLAKHMRGMKNSVREVDRPVRRTDSVPLRGVRSPNEGGVGGEGDIALEHKDWEISRDECKTLRSGGEPRAPRFEEYMIPWCVLPTLGDVIRPP